jgi:hypothetical protein
MEDEFDVPPADMVDPKACQIFPVPINVMPDIFAHKALGIKIK